METINLKHRTEYLNYLDSLAWSEYLPSKGETLPAPAFVTGGNGREYKIYVTDKCPNAHDSLLMHEIGHVVFQHLRNNSLKSLQVKANIKSHWSELQESIKIPDTLNPEDVANATVHMIMNYAQDMQVNSRVFDEDEKEYVNKLTSEVVYSLMSDEEKASADEMLSQKPGTLLAKPVWPEDYHFPRGLDWFEYIELILQNPKDFFNDFSENQNNGQSSKNDGEQNGQNSDSQSNSDSESSDNSENSKESKDSEQSSQSDSEENSENEKSSGNSSEKSENSEKSKVVVNAEDIMKAAENSDTSEKISKLIETQSDSEDFEKAKEETEAKLEENDLLSNTHLSHTSSKRHSKNGQVAEYAGVFTKFEDVEKFIIKHSIVEAKEQTMTDVMYNYNRGKTGNVIVPKIRNRTLSKNENVYLLVDCSSSVPTHVVGKMTEVCKSVSKRMGPLSKVIYWDTDLLAAKKLREVRQELPHGSCTDLAPGVEFIRKNFLRKDPNGVLFIISDFEDDNVAIAKEAEKFKHVFGVKWVENGYSSVNKDTMLNCYSNMKFCEFEISR